MALFSTLAAVAPIAGAVTSGIGSLVASRRRNRALEIKANIEQSVLQKRAVGEFLEGQLNIGQLESTLAAGGIDVKSTGIENILREQIGATFDRGFDVADETARRIRAGQTTGLSDFVGGAAASVGSYFRISSAFDNLRTNRQLRNMASGNQS